MRSRRASLLFGSLYFCGAEAFSQQKYTTTSRRKIALRVATVDIDERTQRDVWTMDQYMTDCGVQRSEGISLYDSSTGHQQPGMDFGLMTQTDLPAESPVLCVPANMILNSKELREGELVGIIESAEEYLEIMGVDVREYSMYHLFLKILLEYEKGDESPWFPWLNSLPRYYSNGASMTRT